MRPLFGGMPGGRQPALRVAAVAMPEGMPETAAPFVAELRKAGRRAADATTVSAAAQATVAMATGCATCHRGMGVFPAPSRPAGPDIGGGFGHMLEHQRAADEMLIGLMVPSTSDWRQGADRLRAAVLLPGQLPADLKLTKDIRKLDLRVHGIAESGDRRRNARRAGERVHRVTRKLQRSVTVCTARLWGPGRGGGTP